MGVTLIVGYKNNWKALRNPKGAELSGLVNELLRKNMGLMGVLR